MALATVVGILEDGKRIGLELDNESVVWGDARMVRNSIARCGLRVGDLIDYHLEDSGALASFNLAGEDSG